MTTPIVAVIPTKDKYDDARHLALQLAEEALVARVLIYDNRDDACKNGMQHVRAPGEAVFRVGSPGKTVYEMWNAGWQHAVKKFPDQPVDVAILNDDITLLPGSLTEMSDALRHRDDVWLVSADWRHTIAEYLEDRCEFKQSAEPEFTGLHLVRGTYRNLGIAGWCFMLKGEKLNNPLPPIDEQFRWWCGDDDLCRNINLAGAHTAIALGVPVDHEGTATGALYPDLVRIGEEDLQRFERKCRG